MASGTWTLTTGGNWNLATTAPWSGGVVADGADSTATFSSNITATAVVTSTENRTIGNLTFSDNGASGSAWSLASSAGTFTIDVSSGAPLITTTTAATISLALNGTKGFNKADASTLTLTGSLANLTGTININSGGGSITITPGTAYTFSGDITGAASTSVTKSGATVLTLTGTTISVPTFTISGATTFAPTSGNTQTVSSVIGGAGSLTKAGAGTTILTGGGSATGLWTVSEGALNVTTNALTGAGSITINSGATLTTDVGSTRALTVNGTVVRTAGAQTTGTINIGTVAGAVAKYTLSDGSITHPTGSIFDVVTNATSRAALYQNNNITATGGSTTAGTNFGAVTASTSYMYWSGKGGTFSTGSNSFFMLGYFYRSGAGAGGSPTVADIDGTILSIGRMLIVGNSGTNSTSVHILSGVHSLAVGAANSSFGFAGASGLGTNVTGAATTQQRMTVQGASTSFTSTCPLFMRGNATGALNQLNIRNGATVTVAGGTLDGATPKQINLIDGSKFSTTAAITDSTGTATVTLYGNNNKVSAGTSASGVLSANIVNATGGGVTSITNSAGNEGADYIGAPVVVLSGGDGTGASARAVWDSISQTITGFEVTNPGTGYTVAPTVVLSGATLANNCCTTEVNTALITVNLGANATDGTITKTEIGTLILTGTNTYGGETTVNDGTLSIGNGNAAGTLGLNDAGNVSITLGKTLKFNRNDERTYTGVISGQGNITKTTSAGTAILDADNTFSGTVTATTGALRAVRNDSFGTGASALIASSGGSIELAGGITLSRSVTITGAGVGSNGALRNFSDNNTITGAIDFSASNSVVGSSAGTLILSNTGTISRAAWTLLFVGNGDIDFSPVLALTTGGVTKSTGTGCAILRGTNTYTGVTTITTGRLGFISNIASGVAGNFGNATLATSLLIAANAGVRYYGTGSATFSRPYRFDGGAASINYLESNGTGAVTFTTAPTYGTTSVAKTMGLGGTGIAANKIDFVVANNVGANAVGITKADAGKWVLTKNNTATGAYAVNGGTLVLQGTNTPSSVAVSNSGTTLVLETETGATRTGTATVTVNAGAKIQTLKGTNQRGRCAYQNLTFAAGSSIRLGG